ncbi:HNH endonuclease [Streptomyces pactum]|uniref:HNH endonuclease n=1 Tax=Streptomyces pactum TaxID=68249 RepID=A0ABS0NGM1_9ACTN|nr:HNH endonuclease [Streptomyces pactum]MBH5334342.1 HNH endonuclease [Streptomyces pactum]
MARTRITSALAAAAATAAAVAGTAPPAAAAPGDTVTTTVPEALGRLQVAAEDRTGYSRGKFPHWTDEDQDGCDTREDVLVEEAVTPPTVDARCTTVVGGAWHSYYDKKDHTGAGGLGIDHTVPLGEAWGSGASRWSEEERRRFANDRDDPRVLNAVSATEIRLKAGRDPARWEPSDDSADCRYIAEWVVVKSRYRLSADRAEAAALENMAAECPDEAMEITYTTAR